MILKKYSKHSESSQITIPKRHAAILETISTTNITPKCPKKNVLSFKPPPDQFHHTYHHSKILHNHYETPTHPVLPCFINQTVPVHFTSTTTKLASKKKNLSTLSTTTKTAISSLMNIGIRFPPRPHTHFIFSRSINTPLSTIYHTFINLVFPRRFRSYNNWSSGSLHCVSNQRKWSLLGSSEVWVTYTENKK